MATTLTTKEEISGDRLNKQQMADALTLQSTTVRDSPIGANLAAVKVGVLAVTIGIIGCVALHLLKPKPSLGQDKIIVDNKSYSMYARDGSTFYPVLNLASARLVAKANTNPEVVDHDIIARQQLGPLIGIPGAPNELSVNPDPNAQWGVCDDNGQTSFIGGLTPTSGTRFTDDDARYVSVKNRQYVIWKSRKMRVNGSNTGVLNALGIDSTVPPFPVSEGFINSLQYYPDLIAPRIPHRGALASAPWKFYRKLKLRVGSVIEMDSVSTGKNLFVILDHGIQPVSEVVGQMLLASSLTKQFSPIHVTSADIAAVRKIIELDTSFYPEHKLNFIPPDENPVTCYVWFKKHNETPTNYLVYSHGLPFDDEILHRSLNAVLSHAQAVADRIIFPGGVGFFVYSTGNDGTAYETSSIAYIDNRGIAYSIDPINHAEVARYLGFNDDPIPIPADMAKLLQNGPLLSRQDALVAHGGSK